MGHHSQKQAEKLPKLRMCIVLEAALMILESQEYFPKPSSEESVYIYVRIIENTIFFQIGHSPYLFTFKDKIHPAVISLLIVLNLNREQLNRPSEN